MENGQKFNWKMTTRKYLIENVQLEMKNENRRKHLIEKCPVGNGKIPNWKMNDWKIEI